MLLVCQQLQLAINSKTRYEHQSAKWEEFICQKRPRFKKTADEDQFKSHNTKEPKNTHEKDHPELTQLGGGGG